MDINHLLTGVILQEATSTANDRFENDKIVTSKSKEEYGWFVHPVSVGDAN